MKAESGPAGFMPHSKLPAVDPILIEVTRGSIVESVHHGRAVIVHANGSIEAAWGDIESPIFPRSALKPIQAIPLITTGAAEHYGVNDREIALACGSHSGEPFHLDTVQAWLKRIDVPPLALVCGPHVPISEAAALELARNGVSPSRLHNNCSGKHAGFLTTAIHEGERAANYGDIDHPVQKRVRTALGELAGIDSHDLPWGIDGCNAPNFAVPLIVLATLFARLGHPETLSPALRAACERIGSAMIAHPECVGGSDRFDTLVMRQARGRILLKSGAEGTCAAALPALGIGIAIKIDDGAQRAATAAMATLLIHYGALSESDVVSLYTHAFRPVTNTADKHVGVIRPATSWLALDRKTS